MIKRCFDLFVACIALIVFCLPALIIAFFILFKEKHPIIFRQQRIGRHKKTFSILKFQTMVDGVVTPTGKVLRKTGLDEIPQFVNVFSGEMSVVGPRALTLSDIERLQWNDAYHALRWNSRPGITGFAQIYGGQHRKTSWFWDRYYIRHHHLLIDFVIIAASFCMNLFGKTKVRRIIFNKNNLL